MAMTVSHSLLGVDRAGVHGSDRKGARALRARAQWIAWNATGSIAIGVCDL